MRSTARGGIKTVRMIRKIVFIISVGFQVARYMFFGGFFTTEVGVRLLACCFVQWSFWVWARWSIWYRCLLFCFFFFFAFFAFLLSWLDECRNSARGVYGVLPFLYVFPIMSNRCRSRHSLGGLPDAGCVVRGCSGVV